MRRPLVRPPIEANLFPDVRCQGRAPRAAKRSLTLDSGHPGSIRLSLHLCLSLLLFLISSQALAAERAAALCPAEIRSLLGSVRKAYTSSPSVTADFVETYAPAGFPPVAPESGKVVLQAPDRLRFDYRGPEGKVFTFDGKAARQYVAADRQMIVRTLAPEDRERLPLLFFESAESVLQRYDARATGSDSGLVEVTLTPKGGGEPALIGLAVTRQGTVERLEVTDTAGNRTAFTFSKTVAGGRRPVSDFTLKPPAGTKVLSE